ncbi:MAG TPA: N,N-dimethylformamidase beta subunit family domain-containing protein, partial [Acidimicrobiales bacterium]|nr:N,N-dimethylformamidase beta subunit family domain-containing protein [Acidimicrobiales bacterium]
MNSVSGDRPTRLGRRRFLQGAGAALALPALAASGVIDTGAVAGRPRWHPLFSNDAGAPSIVTPGGVAVPGARWLQEENARPGTLDWIVTGHQQQRAIEGFAGSVSAAAGDELPLFVHTLARSFHVEAYRMGYYQGLGARLVWRSDQLAGTSQPPPVLTAGTNTVECRWKPSLSLAVDGSWPPGAYLLKLVGSNGEQQFVPLCVRDDTSSATFVVQHSVTTWQAYNLWGGYSLYYGSTGGGFTFTQSPNGKTYAQRARVVSFDRPYPQTWAQGASDFLGNEFPLVYDMERLGLDVAYVTDLDVHRNPSALLRHRCLLSLGHDEYWSLEMRDGVARARDAGLNVAFLGANACYRPIRMAASPM